MQKVELAVLLGRNIVSLRKRLQINQKDLAERLDITSDAMMKIEKGTIAPKMGRLQEIADALQCPVSSLFLDENTNSANEIAYTIAESMRGLSHEDTKYVTQLLDSTILYIKNKS